MSNTITTTKTTSAYTTTDGPPTISLNDAIQRAASWRELVASLPSQTGNTAAIDPPLIPSQLIFRAINIKMSDINWLKEQHPDADSVRLYMSIPDPDFPFQICGMLVPVDAQNQDMLTLNVDPAANHEDVLNSAAVSTIYDFTQPCPTMCNTQSPLFSGTNSAIPYLRYKTQ